MRQILFRGKKNDLDTWEYGDLIVYTTDDNVYISNIYSGTPLHAPEALPEDVRCEFSVNPETVGQSTGLMDKNGVKIFEGDIVKLSNSTAVVSWENGGLGYISKSWGDFISFAGHNHLKSILSYIEVIGNIYDNPELLEEK